MPADAPLTVASLPSLPTLPSLPRYAPPGVPHGVADARIAAVTLAAVAASTLPTIAASTIAATLLVAVVVGTALRRPLSSERSVVVAVTAAAVLGGAVGLAAAGLPLGGTLGLHALALGFLGVPVVLAIAVPARLGVRWRWLALGAATWVATMPFVYAGSTLGAALGGEVGAAVGVALAAGVFEELSRAVAFWRTGAGRGQALVAGIGHGGLEALAFGGQALGMAVFLGPELWLSASTLFALAVSRVVFVGVHVGLSVKVARAVALGRPTGLLAAVALHVLIDLAALVVPVVWVGGGPVAGALSVVGAGLVAGAWLRERRRPRAHRSLAGVRSRVAQRG